MPRFWEMGGEGIRGISLGIRKRIRKENIKKGRKIFFFYLHHLFGISSSTLFKLLTLIHLSARWGSSFHPLPSSKTIPLLPFQPFFLNRLVISDNLIGILPHGI
jgi:hypothetical protein